MVQVARRLRVNVVSETGMLGLTHQGGHTGFLDCAAILATHPDLDVRVNDPGPCDVLHSHSWGPGYLWWGRGMAGRRVFTAHVVPATAEGAIPLERPLRPVVRAWLRFVYDWSDVVVSVGPVTSEHIRSLGVRSRIETVPNPIRTDRFRPAPELRAEGRRLMGVSGDGLVVLGVGQIQPRKGLASFAAVAARFPHVHFVWVGGRPFGLATAGRASLDRLMRSPPPNLTFAGLVDPEKMPAVYNAADVFLFPSWQENGPYAPLEAAACGVPAVLRDLPEYRALYAGPTLTATDDAGFARHVASLLGSAATRARWRAIAQRMVRPFSVDAYVDRMVGIYDGLVRQAAATASSARPARSIVRWPAAPSSGSARSTG
jgi:1,2-diacylglycerol-3-alpha-glucose alpha-1,2-galactosyltransferase